MTRDIRDFFHIKLDSLPHLDFTKTGSDVNDEGKKVNTFIKSLKTPVFSLFDKIEVQEFEEGTKNILFTNYKIEDIRLRDLKILINSLFWFYGKDSTGKGLFTMKDRMQFQSQSNYMLFGRSWSVVNGILTPVDLFVNQESKMLSLNIWGIGKPKNAEIFC